MLLHKNELDIFYGEDEILYLQKKYRSQQNMHFFEQIQKISIRLFNKTYIFIMLYKSTI